MQALLGRRSGSRLCGEFPDFTITESNFIFKPAGDSGIVRFPPIEIAGPFHYHGRYQDRGGDMSAIIDNSKRRKAKLKELILKLHAGQGEEKVRQELLAEPGQHPLRRGGGGGAGADRRGAARNRGAQALRRPLGGAARPRRPERPEAGAGRASGRRLPPRERRTAQGDGSGQAGAGGDRKKRGRPGRCHAAAARPVQPAVRRRQALPAQGVPAVPVPGETGRHRPAQGDVGQARRDPRPAQGEHRGAAGARGRPRGAAGRGRHAAQSGPAGDRRHDDQGGGDPAAHGPGQAERERLGRDCRPVWPIRLLPLRSSVDWPLPAEGPPPARGGRDGEPPPAAAAVWSAGGTYSIYPPAVSPPTSSSPSSTPCPWT